MNHGGHREHGERPQKNGLALSASLESDSEAVCYGTDSMVTKPASVPLASHLSSGDHARREIAAFEPMPASGLFSLPGNHNNTRPSNPAEARYIVVF